METSSLVAEGINGSVELLGDRIRIKRKGLGTVFTHGLQGEKDIRISTISSIQLRKPGSFTNGYIQFAFMGGRESKSGILGAAQDENTVMFESKHLPMFLRVKQEIESRMNAPESSKEHLSDLDDLEKLASLRDRGIVTEEEFQAKKRQILGL